MTALRTDPRHPAPETIADRPAGASDAAARTGRRALLHYALLLLLPLPLLLVEAGLAEGLLTAGGESAWVWAALAAMFGLYGHFLDREDDEPDAAVPPGCHVDVTKAPDTGDRGCCGAQPAHPASRNRSP